MKNGIYTRFQKYTKDKDKATAFLIDTMLQKTLSMFHYENLPPSIPQNELENILQRFGFAIVAEVNGNLYALRGGLGGEQNAYYKPTIATVANPYLKLTKDFTLFKARNACNIFNALTWSVAFFKGGEKLRKIIAFQNISVFFKFFVLA